MARPSSTIDRLFARLEAAADGRPGDPGFVRRHVTGMGKVVTGEGVQTLVDRVGARAFTTDRGTIAIPELRANDPENVALLFHEFFHQRDGHAHGGEAEERKAQAQEAMVYHLAHDEGVTDIGAILSRLEGERDAWLESAHDQPGGVVQGVRASPKGQEVRKADAKPEPATKAPGKLRGPDAMKALLDAGYSRHGIVRELVTRWRRMSKEERRLWAYRFAGRTAT
ncbi:MAG: hypothetical protein AAGA48_06170 [Myxococcota bacterium]